MLITFYINEAGDIPIYWFMVQCKFSRKAVGQCVGYQP